MTPVENRDNKLYMRALVSIKVISAKYQTQTRLVDDFDMSHKIMLFSSEGQRRSVDGAHCLHGCISPGRRLVTLG